MSPLAVLLRRGAQPQAAACSRAVGQFSPWDALRQAFGTLHAGGESGFNPGTALRQPVQGAATAAAATAAAATAVPPAQAPPRQRPQGSSGQRGSQRDPALALHLQHMQQALQRGDYQLVLQLLRQAESGGGSGSSGSSGRVATAAAAAAGWDALDRAALYDCALRACALRGDPAEARRLVDRMWKGGVPVGVVAHTSVLRALCAVGRQADALQYLRSVPSKRQRTPMYTLLLRSCNRAGALRVGQEAYAMFQKRQHPADAALMSEAVRLLGALGDAEAAEAAWQQAVAAAGSGSEQACLHAARVEGLAKSGRLGAAIAALESMMDQFAALLPVDVSFASSSADSSSDSSGSNGSENISSSDPTMAAAAPASSSATSSPAASPVHHMQAARNAVLAAAHALGDRVAAKDVTSLATLRGLPPDVGTYNILLRATIEHEDGLQAVQEGVHEVRALGMRPDRDTYRLLLRACAAERDTEAAEAAFSGMAADGVLPTRLLHNALLAVYSAAGDVAGADAAYRRMRSAGVDPEPYTMRLLFDTVRHWADLEAAGRAVSEDHATTASIERMHQRQLASTMLARWVADVDTSRAVLLTPSVFLSLLNAYSHSGQVYRVLQVMRDAFGCRLPPDTLRVIGGSGSGGSGSGSSGSGSSGGGSASSSAASAAGAVASEGGHSSSSSSNSDGGAGGSSGVGAQDSVKPESSSAGVHSDMAAASETGGSSSGGSGSGSIGSGSSGSSTSGSSSGLDALEAAVTRPSRSSRSRRSSRQEESTLLSRLSTSTLERAHLAPTVPIFNAAIAACTRVGYRHMGDAVALLKSMLACGLSPDAHTYTSLIAGCAYGRQAALARELLRDMQSRGIQPTTVTHNALLKVECWTYGVDAGTGLLHQMMQQGMQPDRATWSLLLAAAKHAQRADVADMALEQLAGRDQQEESAAAAAASAVAEAGAQGALGAGEDHRWHGYYDQQQEDEDDW